MARGRKAAPKKRGFFYRTPGKASQTKTDAGKFVTLTDQYSKPLRDRDTPMAVLKQAMNRLGLISGDTSGVKAESPKTIERPTIREVCDRYLTGVRRTAGGWQHASDACRYAL
jgi:hypothetical protein